MYELPVPVGEFVGAVNGKIRLSLKINLILLNIYNITRFADYAYAS